MTSIPSSNYSLKLVISSHFVLFFKEFFFGIKLWHAIYDAILIEYAHMCRIVMKKATGIFLSLCGNNNYQLTPTTITFYYDSTLQHQQLDVWRKWADWCMHELLMKMRWKKLTSRCSVRHALLLHKWGCESCGSRHIMTCTRQ